MRTYGKTIDCKGCRYWSEMIAMSRGLKVHALCLAPRTDDALLAGTYTSPEQTCEAWASGHLGPVDEPGNDSPAKYLRPSPVVVELSASVPYGYLKRGGALLKEGDLVRLLDRAEVCTVMQARPAVIYEGTTFRVWDAQVDGRWVPILEIDTPDVH